MRKTHWLCLLMLATPIAQAQPEYFEIDPTHTYPHFAIDHLDFSTLYGRFDQTTGRLMIDKDNNNGFVSIEIAAVSISTGYQKRDDHLRSPDFLNVMEFPKIKYNSRNLKFTGESQAIVEGDLTMLGVTRPVQLEVTRIRCGKNPMSKKDTCGMEAQTQIKRSEFGSKYGLPNIGDTMKLWFQVEAIRE
ncbi:MAG: YceI family protein [Gammaproteobacteria bacterium]|nr:YceI family protein [Gammaproteobacteria bacterium]